MKKLHTRLNIAPILSGILTQLALYSINLHIHGNKANQAIPLNKVHVLIFLRNIVPSLLICLLIAEPSSESCTGSLEQN